MRIWQSRSQPFEQAMRIQSGVSAVLASATLFGASTPFARALGGGVDPLWLAGLLYAGSGLGLSLLLLLRHAGIAGARRRVTGIARPDLPWLAFSIVAAGGEGEPAAQSRNGTDRDDRVVRIPGASQLARGDGHDAHCCRGRAARRW